MTTLAVAALLYAAVITVLYAVVKLGADDAPEADHSTCRREIEDAVKVAAYWKAKAQARYERPGFVGVRPSLDAPEQLADAMRVVEGGNVLRLPRQRGGA